MLVPSLWKHPLSPDWQHFWTPLSRAFRRLFLPWRPPKSKTLLNVPPYIYFITPFLNFSGVQRERERKSTPFLKEISGWKVKYPPCFYYNSRAGLCRTKSTPLPEILGTRMRSLRPRSGGGGGGGREYFLIRISEKQDFLASKRRKLRLNHERSFFENRRNCSPSELWASSTEAA